MRLKKRTKICDNEKYYNLHIKNDHNYIIDGGYVVKNCHEAKANSLIGILEKATDCPYKIGLTGTLHDAEAHKWVIEGLLGPEKKVASTSELIEKGLVSNLKIEAVQLIYNEADKKEVRKKENRVYSKEIDWLATHPARNNFLTELSISLDKNSLLLFTKIEHGKILYKEIQEKIDSKGLDKKVFLIYGQIPVKIRQEIIKTAKQDHNVIIVASYGVFSTGINIPNLHNLIFGSPTKSKIRVLQSIGRILRLHETKKIAVLYDIADDMSHGSYINFSLQHFTTRFQYYMHEKFSYKIHRINI